MTIRYSKLKEYSNYLPQIMGMIFDLRKPFPPFPKLHFIANSNDFIYKNLVQTYTYSIKQRIILTSINYFLNLLVYCIKYKMAL